MLMTKFNNQNFPSRLSAIGIGVILIGLSASVWAASADDPQPDVDDSSQTSAEQKIEPATADQTEAERIKAICGGETASESWIDRSYSYLNEHLCAPAVWFDGFFGDPRSLEENPVNTFIRLRTALGWDQTKGTSGGVQVRANIVLPQISDRVRLLISRDEDVSGDGLDGLGLEGDDDKTRLGFRFILGQELKGLMDLDATIRVQSGELNPRISTRARYSARPMDDVLFRATQTGFWERIEGFGTQSRLDLEWSPRPERLVRWTTRGTFSEASNGVDWKSLLIAYQQLDRHTAIRADAGISGETRPTLETEEYFVSVRLRRQFLRPWLFVELRPERAWPLDALTNKRRSDWRVTTTLEIQFENQPPSYRRRWDIQR